VAIATPADAYPYHHHRAYKRVVIQPRVVNPAQEAWWYGATAYPGHQVPLAAYTGSGIGLIWAPFGWDGMHRRY
jgi:hypothetical protein